jgi:hypothetical protein
MPALNIDNKDIVLPNYNFSEKYWPILSKIAFNEIGFEETSDSKIVQNVLKKCFLELCSILESKISEEKSASFYIFCQKIHEDSIDLWRKQANGFSLGEIEEDFAASRRVLKIILEQSCKLDLTGAPNFLKEINNNVNEYILLLEELLYLGTWCYTISEYISRSQLFPLSIGIKILNNELNILTIQPFPELFKFLFNELKAHNSCVVFSNSINDFKDLLLREYNVDYNILCSFINQQRENPIYRFGLLKMQAVIKELVINCNYDDNFVSDFYKGLTIDRSNSLNVADCFLQNQHENRHVYRPILELTIDNKSYHMIGYNKWLESLTLLTTNSFPFGIYPIEWKKYTKINDFVNHINRTHDKILENPIVELLKEKNKVFDFNLVTFLQKEGNNINIKSTVGDIDILFIDEKDRILYICECKHNRSRFDLNNWKRDYTKFKNKYEKQLSNKVNWARNNLSIIKNHLEIKYNLDLGVTFENYEIKGIFIINAPTVYMLNGNFRTFTISDFRELLSDSYTNIKLEFTNKSNGKKFLVEYPYFDNVEKQLRK